MLFPQSDFKLGVRNFIQSEFSSFLYRRIALIHIPIPSFLSYVPWRRKMRRKPHILYPRNKQTPGTYIPGAEG